MLVMQMLVGYVARTPFTLTPMAEHFVHGCPDDPLIIPCICGDNVGLCISRHEDLKVVPRRTPQQGGRETQQKGSVGEGKKNRCVR